MYKNPHTDSRYRFTSCIFIENNFYKSWKTSHWSELFPEQIARDCPSILMNDTKRERERKKKQKKFLKTNHSSITKDKSWMLKARWLSISVYTHARKIGQHGAASEHVIRCNRALKLIFNAAIRLKSIRMHGISKKLQRWQVYTKGDGGRWRGV